MCGWVGGGGQYNFRVTIELIPFQVSPESDKESQLDGPWPLNSTGRNGHFLKSTWSLST